VGKLGHLTTCKAWATGTSESHPLASTAYNPNSFVFAKPCTTSCASVGRGQQSAREHEEQGSRARVHLLRQLQPKRPTLPDDNHVAIAAKEQTQEQRCEGTPHVGVGRLVLCV